jgi:6-phosphogluconolactonase
MAVVQIFEEKELFAHLADEFISTARRSIADRGRFTVALAGGSTPVKFYEALAAKLPASKIDLSKVFFFFGDERDVSPESERSNYRLARDLFFKPLGVPASNVKRWLTEIIDAEEVAVKYEQTLRRFFELPDDGFPKFDLILLGLGDDCHTASLFPNTDALKVTDRIAVMNRVEKLDSNRLTLTFPVINNARKVVFAVVGEAKAEALREAVEGERNCSRFPAGCVDPTDGKLIWMSDKEAAALLEKKKR